MIIADIVDWLSTQPIGASGKIYKTYQGPNPPATEPKPYFLVTGIPGGRIQSDGTQEELFFQVKVVGPQGVTGQDHNSKARVSERLAKDLDRFLLTVNRPIIGNALVTSVDRFGGAPYGNPYDEKSRRFSFTCTYYLLTESEIF